MLFRVIVLISQLIFISLNYAAQTAPLKEGNLLDALEYGKNHAEYRKDAQFYIDYIRKFKVDFKVTTELEKKIRESGNYLGGKEIENLLAVLRANFYLSPSPLQSIVESDFSDQVIKSSLPVLVFFCTESDKACNITAPSVEEIAELYQGKIKFIKVDVYINQHVSRKYDASFANVPVLALFSGGTELGRIIGAASKQSILRLIEKPSEFKVAKPSIRSASGEVVSTLPSILESDFKGEVLASPKPTLVFFCSSLDSACKLTLPSVEAVAQELGEKIKVVMVDVYINRIITKQYNAESYKIPVLVLFNGGRESGRIVGAASKQSITHLIEKPEDFNETKTSDGIDTIPAIVESDFDYEVLKSPIPVLVFFCNNRDDACKLTSSSVAEIGEEYKGKVKVVKVDAAINRNISIKYNAYYWPPALILFNRGKERDRIDGAASKAGIARMIEKALSKK